MKSFSAREIGDLVKAYLLVSIAFAILFSKGEMTFFPAFGIALISVGSGFLLHELAHKFTAQYYRCRAEFYADNFMLILGLILAALASFIFVVPGAVHISNVGSKKERGVIALSGPLTNIVLAFAFLLLPLGPISSYGFYVNALLAVFNLIPFGFFDGKDVFRWNKIVYGISMVVAIILFVGVMVLSGQA